MTREELSRITGVSSRTIYRAENKPGGYMKGENAVAIFRALNKYEIMSAHEIQTFIDGSGVDRELWAREIERLKNPPPKQPPPPAAVTDQRAELVAEVLSLTDRHDPAQVLALLRSLKSLLNTPARGAGPHPSIPNGPDGSIEERKVIKEPVSKPSAAPLRAIPHIRRGSN